MAKQRGPSSKKKSASTPAKKPAATTVSKKQKPRATASSKTSAAKAKAKRPSVISKTPPRSSHPTAKRTPSQSAGQSKPAATKVRPETAVNKPVASKPAVVSKPAVATKMAVVAAKTTVVAAKKPQPSSNGHISKVVSSPAARAAAPAQTSSRVVSAPLNGGRGSAAQQSARASGIARVSAAARRTVAQKKVVAEVVDRRKLAAVPSRNGHSDKNKPKQDRIVTMVRDPFWLHVFWEITPESIQRTEAALGPDWYTAKPILRVLDVSSEDTTSSAESVLRDIVIHGGVNNWYLDIDGTARSYRVDVGYLTAKGRFFALARSNMVTPPKPGASDNVDGHWTSVREECDKIFAMSGGADPQNNSDKLQKFFEERFGRPMSAGSLTNYGSGALSATRRQQFHFDLDAELIVHGRTVTDARVIVHGEPVQLRKDGSFTLRFGLPDGRQILPATASTNDGIEERTVIIAIERNTKVLEPMIHDGQE